jgi:hypothetical protein
MASGHKLGIFGDVEDQEALPKLARDAIRKQFFKAWGIEEKEAAVAR